MSKTCIYVELPPHPESGCRVEMCFEVGIQPLGTFGHSFISDHGTDVVQDALTAACLTATEVLKTQLRFRWISCNDVYTETHGLRGLPHVSE